MEMESADWLRWKGLQAGRFDVDGVLCDLQEREALEGCTAKTPMTIEHIQRNMDNLEVSKRTTKKGSDDKIEEGKFSRDKSHMTATFYTVRKPLKDEISYLLRASASAKKNGGTFAFKIDIKSNNILKSKCSKNHFIDDSIDNTINMKQIQVLDQFECLTPMFKIAHEDINFNY